MSNARNIVVRFDETSWNYWGIPWTASLNMLAKFPGQVVVVDFGIPAKAHEFIARLDNYVAIPAEKKYGLQELDFVYTVSKHVAKTNDIYAAWDNTCYFQDGVNEVFDLATDKLVCCRGADPQLNIRSSVVTFGYKEDVTKDQDRLYSILKKVARHHAKTLGGGFLAGPSSVWATYASFLEVCLETGFFLPVEQSAQAALNLFALCYDTLVSVVDDTWCQPISGEFEWNDGFCCKNKKIHVVHIPADMQYSAESAAYHFRNRYSKLHDEWSSFYKGCSFKPKRVMKPSLGKLKKVT